MFGNKDKQPSAAGTVAPVQASPAPVSDSRPASRNYLSSGTVIEGNIVSSDELYLDGTVKGDVRAATRLVMGKDAVVEGNIVAAEAEIAGRITGTVETKGLLAIKATCVIEGDIVTKSLNVESGSSFNGRCKVGGAADRNEPVNRLKSLEPAVKAPMAAKPTGLH
jgi:cytoskeletal protein CcmA (bactofilin family)